MLVVELELVVEDVVEELVELEVVAVVKVVDVVVVVEISAFSSMLITPEDNTKAVKITAETATAIIAAAAAIKPTLKCLGPFFGRIPSICGFEPISSLLIIDYLSLFIISPPFINDAF